MVLPHAGPAVIVFSGQPEQTIIAMHEPSLRREKLSEDSTWRDVHTVLEPYAAGSLWRRLSLWLSGILALVALILVVLHLGDPVLDRLKRIPSLAFLLRAMAEAPSNLVHNPILVAETESFNCLFSAWMPLLSG